MSTPPCAEETITFESNKKYEIDNDYILNISYNKELMLIEIEAKTISFPKKQYNLYINLEQLQKLDIYFCQFTSLSEVCDCFEELIKIKNLSVIKEEKLLKIKIINPSLKSKEIFINMPIKEKDISNQINSIISYINSLNDKINSMKIEYDEKINLLEEKVKRNEDKINHLENNKENKDQKLKSIPKSFQKSMIIIDSKIIKINDEMSFLNEKLENDFNSKIKYNLIYRATRDGSKTDDFNKCVNGKDNQLVILKTKKGLIFGGYTGRGFQNTEKGKIKDDSVFLFSLDNKKIYNIKKGSDALYEFSPIKFGIFFGKSNGNNPIFLGSQNCDMLSYESNTCSKNNEEFSFNFDYELNGGEKDFQLQEIEVFQITKK